MGQSLPSCSPCSPSPSCAARGAGAPTPCRPPRGAALLPPGSRSSCSTVDCSPKPGCLPRPTGAGWEKRPPRAVLLACSGPHLRARPGCPAPPRPTLGLPRSHPTLPKATVHSESRAVPCVLHEGKVTWAGSRARGSPESHPEAQPTSLRLEQDPAGLPSAGPPCSDLAAAHSSHNSRPSACLPGLAVWEGALA